MRTSIAAALGIILLFGAGCDSASNDPEWELVWSDEFNGSEGQSPDATKWTYDIGGDGWGNSQLEYNSDRPENASLDGQGNLAITAIKEPFQGNQYSSARLVTRDLYETTYGRFEARIKLPWGQGYWPAFWMLGANIDEVPWPECGEIDIMEYAGNKPTVLHGSLHGPGYSGSNPVTKTFQLLDERFDTDFYVFAVEWEKDEIRWYVDDILYHQVKADDVPGRWVYDHDFYLLLNLAIGGTFGGPPAAETVFPQSMLVDYVRVYKDRS